MPKKNKLIFFMRILPCFFYTVVECIVFFVEIVEAKQHGFDVGMPAAGKSRT